MTANSKKWPRDVNAALDRIWSDWSVGLTSCGHLKVTLRHKGRQRVIFTSGTPSDKRVMRNFETKVRRAIRELKEEATA